MLMAMSTSREVDILRSEIMASVNCRFLFKLKMFAYFLECIVTEFVYAAATIILFSFR